MGEGDRDRELNKAIHERIGRMISRGHRRRAMDLLDKVIEESLPLFEGEPWVIEERRLAWIYRIDLLREWGRLTEALAWACLEVEINPDNVSALALKSRLKREAGLIPRSSSVESTPTGTRKSPSPCVWAGVAGMRDLKAMLERDVILPLMEPEIYARYRVGLPNGILLYGPPGCGKTYIARKLAEVVSFSFIEVTPSDIASIYVHGTQGKIAELFTKAKMQAPSMIFFDELDAMVPKRSGSDVGHHYSSEVNEFLVQLNECGKSQLLVIGATNRPRSIDLAVIRPGRMDKKFFVGPPDYEARVELLRLYMAGRPQEALDWHGCAFALENYTCAEIEFVVNEAARIALPEKRFISSADILHVAVLSPPSHSSADIEAMRNL